MIEYNRRNTFRSLLSIFQLRGSVFPFAVRIALPCTILTGIFEWLSESNLISFVEPSPDDSKIMGESAVWSGFTSLVGFAVVFRTSIAYARFWDGASATHQMRAEWFDACSAIVAFCKHSKEDRKKVWKFKHLLIRLFSLLHALALADIEDSATGEISDIQAFKRDLIDVDGLDDESLLAVRDSDAKVQLAFQWIQQLIVENIQTGVLTIPPPILSRVFQELANGMVQFHEAVKVSTIPFPFPYSQTCDALLAFHWVLTPVINAQWVNSIVWSMIFTFVQVMVLWSLNSIAVEIENPFGHDPNDLDQAAMQVEMNRQLLLLIRPQAMRTPSLSSRAILDLTRHGMDRQQSLMEPMRRGSIVAAWNTAEQVRVSGRLGGSGRGSLMFSDGRGSLCSSVAEDELRGGGSSVGVIHAPSSMSDLPSTLSGVVPVPSMGQDSNLDSWPITPELSKDLSSRPAELLSSPEASHCLSFCAAPSVDMYDTGLVKLAEQEAQEITPTATGSNTSRVWPLPEGLPPIQRPLHDAPPLLGGDSPEAGPGLAFASSREPAPRISIDVAIPASGEACGYVEHDHFVEGGDGSVRGRAPDVPQTAVLHID